MIKSKLSWQFFTSIIIFLIFMLINFEFVKFFLFGGGFIIQEPFLRIGIFMISMLGSLFILYDYTFHITLFRLKNDVFEVRTIFRKEQIPYSDIFYLYEKEDFFRLSNVHILTVQTKKTNFSLKSIFDSNYHSIKEKIVEKAEQDIKILS